MAMYGLSCGYWTDDEAEHTRHWLDHKKKRGDLLTVLDASVLPDNFAELGAMRGCVDGVGAAEHRGSKPARKRTTKPKKKKAVRR